MTIFVSVAAYRDSELVPTVLDCLAKARQPHDLRVVVCWQHLGDEDISAIADDPRVRILEFDARQSRGACWARAQVMTQYSGEDWILQVDSHTRFAADWDVRLIDAAAMTGAAKPLLSCYPPSYDPTVEFTGAGNPTELFVHGWTNDGLPIISQREIPDPSGKPKPAEFVAAGFLFAPGSLALEVPYDPNLYFYGEEISLAVRAYTWGYDLFHPTEVFAWHYYVRTDRPRHWTDHVGAAGSVGWLTRHRASVRRVGSMLRYPTVSRYGVGALRTVADYEAYSGCDFTRRVWTDPSSRTADAPVDGPHHVVDPVPTAVASLVCR